MMSARVNPTSSLLVVASFRGLSRGASRGLWLGRANGAKVSVQTQKREFGRQYHSTASWSESTIVGKRFGLVTVRHGQSTSRTTRTTTMMRHVSSLAKPRQQQHNKLDNNNSMLRQGDPLTCFTRHPHMFQKQGTRVTQSSLGCFHTTTPKDAAPLAPVLLRFVPIIVGRAARYVFKKKGIV